MKNLSIDTLRELITPEILMQGLRILIILVGGLISVRFIALLVQRTITRNASEQSKIIIRKGISYIGFSLVGIVILNEMGVSLSALLGAAGVLGIALGIASQKSIGNIISGFFLVSDKTFEVGDVVKVGTTIGIVYSLDLLSIKLRTFDNMLIRIPNDQIITTEITNITRFPIRRMDFSFTVGFGTDLPRAESILKAIARENPLSLEEPEPFFLLKGFSSSGVELLFAVWFEKSRFVEVKNGILGDIYQRFLEAGIDIPVTQVKVHAEKIDLGNRYPERPLPGEPDSGSRDE